MLNRIEGCSNFVGTPGANAIIPLGLWAAHSGAPRKYKGQKKCRDAVCEDVPKRQCDCNM